MLLFKKCAHLVFATIDEIGGRCRNQLHGLHHLVSSFMTRERTTCFQTHSWSTEMVSCSDSWIISLSIAVIAKPPVHTRRRVKARLYIAVMCLRLWPGQEFIPRAASGISEYGNKVLLSRPPRRSRPFTNYSLKMCAFMIVMKTVVSLNRCWFYKRLFTRFTVNCTLLHGLAMYYWQFKRCCWKQLWCILAEQRTFLGILRISK